MENAFQQKLQKKLKGQHKHQVSASSFDDIVAADISKAVKPESSKEIEELLNVLVKHSRNEITESDQVEEAKRACVKLIKLFDVDPSLKSIIISNSSFIISLIIMLKYNMKNPKVLNFILALINQLTMGNDDLLIHFCIKGILPAIVEMVCGSEYEYTMETKLYLVWFVRRVISLDTTLVMFFTCSALPVLVELLEPDYSENNKELMQATIDCIAQITESEGQQYISKDDYLRFLSDAGIFAPLSTILVSILKSKQKGSLSWVPKAYKGDDDEKGYAEIVGDIFETFSRSKEAEVKKALCQDEILENLRKAIQLMNPLSKEIIPMITAVRYIAAEGFDVQELDEFVVPLLEISMAYVNKNDFVREIFNQATRALCSLCRLKPARQEEAVESGLLTFLKFVITNNKPLREFAVPLLCELARTQTTRQSVLKSDGVQLYFNLLKEIEIFFATDLLEAIAVCYETEKLENVQVSSEYMNYIAAAVDKAQDSQLQGTLDSVLTILKTSTAINKHLGSDRSENGIIAALINKLKKEKRVLSGEKGITSELSPKARVTLIQILQALCAKYQNPSGFLAEYNLKDLITFFAEKDTSMLVKNVAKALLKEGQMVQLE